MDQETILILGGGIGGQVAANSLAPLLKGKHRIILMDKGQNFEFPPSFPWVVAGQRNPADIQKSLPSLLKKGVTFIQAEIFGIDPVSKKVKTSAGPLSFDYLLISLGAELAPGKISGFQEGALNLYTLDGSIQIHKSLQSFDQGKIAVLITSTPFKCPAAPYEAAFLIQDFLKKKGRKGEVVVFTPEPFPMPTAGPKVGEALRGMLESKGIRFYPGHKVTKIDPQGKVLIFENGKNENYDLLVGVPPHEAPKPVKESGLTNETGWIPVDRETLETKYPGIYAIGDVTTIPIAQGKTLPKAGIFAHYQAEIVAANILSRLNHQPEKGKFDGAGWCAIEMGSGVAAFGNGEFYAPNGAEVRLYRPDRFWHLGRVLFEKWWLSPFSIKRKILRLMLKMGARMRGISVSL